MWFLWIPRSPQNSENRCNSISSIYSTMPGEKIEHQKKEMQQTVPEWQEAYEWKDDAKKANQMHRTKTLSFSMTTHSQQWYHHKEVDLTLEELLSEELCAWIPQEENRWKINIWQWHWYVTWHIWIIIEIPSIELQGHWIHKYCIGNASTGNSLTNKLR